jgi:hypothetical protein
MTTLLERLDQLGAQLDTFNRAREERDLVNALRSRRTQLADVRTQVERALDSLARVKRLGGKVARKPPASAALRGKPGAFEERLAIDPDEVAHDKQWDRTLLDPLRIFADRVSEAALLSWQAQVDEGVPPVTDEVFTKLEKFQTPAVVREVHAARERIRQLRGSLPISDGALADVAALGQMIRKVLATLQNLPHSVQTFLSKASSYDATADDFSLDVQQWLRENDLLRLVRIGLKK